MAGTDTRFAVIEDAVALLQMLPAPAEIAWPSDPGDLQALDEALAWLATWLPATRAARRQHKRMLRERPTSLSAVGHDRAQVLR